jgi:hypothetical protein
LVDLPRSDDPATFDQIGMDDLDSGMGFAGWVVVLHAVGALEYFARDVVQSRTTARFKDGR